MVTIYYNSDSTVSLIQVLVKGTAEEVGEWDKDGDD